ncbi:PhzF family phenazine biosynthesis protein [Tepidamorphus sp. 3E244]|uniref:PhzF family phenazine biosynthesis protein n=1 Tax=Tepidamorphus sp. 3E244 TaxID=3385498 RepID=UPI0038FCA29F
MSASSTARRYAVLDVFTDKALTGNQLAVVFDSEGLDGERMQAIAAEFNLSETVFVMEPERPAHSAKVRIFTPGRELPFAGHPTVGTSIILALEKYGGTGMKDGIIVLEEQIGSVRCGVKLRENAGFAEFDIPKLPSEPQQAGDRDLIAAGIGLEPSEIGFENHKPMVCDAGVTFTFVPVRDMARLNRAKASGRAFEEAFGSNGAFIYTRDTASEANDFQARMFAPQHGILEDPATGSAAAALAGIIHKFDQPRKGMTRYRIEQGYAMGRPSIIELELEVGNNALSAVRIGGNAVVIARGELIA